MNVLIILAHPNVENLTHAAAERLRAGFGSGSHQVRVIDLYREQFDPVLIVNASRRRRDLIHDPYTERYRSLIFPRGCSGARGCGASMAWMRRASSPGSTRGGCL